MTAVPATTWGITRLADPGVDESGASPETLGSKGYNLLRLVRAGIHVPPGFVLDTGCYAAWHGNGGSLPEELSAGLQAQLRVLERESRRGFGSRRAPLLVSVRSGAPVSMPGMMETLLNVGLNEDTLSGLVRHTGNPRLAWDSYRRLIQGFARTVAGKGIAAMDEVVLARVRAAGLVSEREMDSALVRDLCNEFLDIYRSETGKEFPRDPLQQLMLAVNAVFRSWMSPRARKYRNLNGVSDSTGTACIVQAMVFGNACGRSGSGVGFTRNPATGADELYLDFMPNAQGEDIVSGKFPVQDAGALQRSAPAVYRELEAIRRQLETEFRDMQDFEFTVEDGELFLLQTRDGKRTPWAALVIAAELARTGMIDQKEYKARLSAIDPAGLERKQLKVTTGIAPAAIGTPAGTGAAVGVAALDEAAAIRFSQQRLPVILVRSDPSTEDIGAISLASGIVTTSGGRTSHAAVVARQLGVVCVVGCHTLEIDLDRRLVRFESGVLYEGDYLSVDADAGAVYAGRLEWETVRPAPELYTALTSAINTAAR